MTEHITPNLFLILSTIALLIGPALFWLSRLNAKSLDFLDSFILISVGGIVLFHILPEAAQTLGWIAIPIALVSFFFPVIFETIKSRFAEPSHNITLVFALVGLMIHTLADGMAFSSPHDLNHSSHALPLGVILHRLPVGMTIWWLLKPKYGAKFSWFILFLLVASTLLGFLFGNTLFHNLDGSVFAIFESIMAGALLHVILHSEKTHSEGSCCHKEPPWNLSAGFGALTGILALLLFHDTHSHNYFEFYEKIQTTFIALALESAPALVLAYLISGILDVYLPKSPFRWISSGKDWQQAMKGMLLGLPLPICSCGVVPVFQTLTKRGVSLAAGLAFFIATPELGLEALIISLPLLGAKMTALRLLFAMVIAFLMAVLIAKLFKGISPNIDSDSLEEDDTAKDKSILQCLKSGFFNAFDETGPWILVGLVVAAFCAPLLETSQIFSKVPSWVEVPIFAIIGIPIYVCASGATPLVAVFVAYGASPGAALAFLITGPATNITTFGILSQLYNKKLAISFATLMLIISISMGLILNFFIPEIHVPDLSQHEHGTLKTIQVLSLGFLGLLLILALMRKGPRKFLDKIIDFHSH